MRSALPAAPLILAVSANTLFDLCEETSVCEPGREDAQDLVPLRPGAAFTLVRKLVALNTPTQQYVEVVLLSDCSPERRLRTFYSLEHHGLAIARAAFTGAGACHRYAASFGAHLFLSNDADEVRSALEQGIAAATMLGRVPDAPTDDVIRVAFDGDAVLFSDEAERVYAEFGLAAFTDRERAARHLPLADGPFKRLLVDLHRLQRLFDPDSCPLRTALVTARGVATHERVLHTLQTWNVHVDEAVFLSGISKGPTLKSFGADIFFDDQQHNCESALTYVPTAHVPYGVKNRLTRPALQLIYGRQSSNAANSLPLFGIPSTGQR